jgi:aerobic-type carbon monoxide dehydrogenase small subunit (CoxS/CutS family)
MEQYRRRDRRRQKRQSIMTISLNVNGQEHAVTVDPATPLLYVLREDLRLNAAKFGCGMGQCGACTVMVDDRATFSCLLPIAALDGRKVVTVEGLGRAEKPSAIQQAFIDEQAAQCGYCIAGMIMRAQSLLQKNADPSNDEIRSHMQPNLCRCGTHMRILRAVRRAADAMRQTRNRAAGLEGGKQ